MKIKTRESLRTIKTFDRAKTLGQKVKNGAGEVKEYGEELQNTRYGSANEYAGNAVENTERRTARNVAYGAGKIGNWGLKETRKNILKWRNRPKKFKVKVQQPKKLPAPKRPALPPAKTTAKTAQKGVKAQTAGIISGMETVYGIVFALIFLREIPTVRELVGGAVILGIAFYSSLHSED